MYRVGDVNYRIAIEAEIESMEGYEIYLEGSALDRDLGPAFLRPTSFDFSRLYPD